MLKISFIIKLSKKLLLLINVPKRDKVDLYSNLNYKDKMVKKLLFKNLNKAIDYLIPNFKQVFT